MSNCNCIEKITAAMEAEAAYLDEPRATMPGVWATAQAASVRRLAARLSLAPAGPQEPCMVVEFPGAIFPFIIETADGSRWWSTTFQDWASYSEPGGKGTGNFQTRAAAEAALPAARAALLAASEPGVVEDKPGRRTMPGGYCAKCGHFAPVAHLEADAQGKSDDLWWCASCRWDATQAECTQPALASTPAAKFDAEKLAAAMFKHNKARGDLNISQHDGERGYSVIISDKADAEMAKKCWWGYIAAALTAAHAAGDAEGYARGRAEQMPSGLTFNGFRVMNGMRALRWHKGGLDEWSVNDWLAAMGGEAGEALNAGKKHRRILSALQQHGNVPDSIGDAEQRIMDELADTVIYADLVAQRLGRSLEAAIVQKFNAISEREGFPERLPAPPAPAKEQP